MNFQTEKLGGHMAAAVSGVDLNRLPDAATQQALIDVLHDNLVLCIRDQNLKPPRLPRRHVAVRNADAAKAARQDARMRRGQHHLE